LRRRIVDCQFTKGIDVPARNLPEHVVDLQVEIIARERGAAKHRYRFTDPSLPEQEIAQRPVGAGIIWGEIDRFSQCLLSSHFIATHFEDRAKHLLRPVIPEPVIDRCPCVELSVVERTLIRGHLREMEQREAQI